MPAIILINSVITTLWIVSISTLSLSTMFYNNVLNYIGMAIIISTLAAYISHKATDKGLVCIGSKGVSFSMLVVMLVVCI